MLLILTRGIFLHFPHYQKSGNLSTLLLAHLSLLATKTLSSAATRLVSRRHTTLLLLPNLSVGRHTQQQGRTGLRDILYLPKNFPDIFWTNTNKMQANSLTIFIIQQNIRECQSDEAKKHPIKTGYNDSPPSQSKQITKSTKTSESLILRKRRQANLQKNRH